MIQEIENKIIEKLKEEITDMAVEGFPDVPGNYMLKHAVGAILVRYAGPKYEKPQTYTRIVQEGNLQYAITVVMRNLHRKKKISGIYDKLDEVREILTGFSPEGRFKLFPVSEDFIDEENGIWQYEIVFMVRQMITEKV